MLDQACWAQAPPLCPPDELGAGPDSGAQRRAQAEEEQHEVVQRPARQRVLNVHQPPWVWVGQGRWVGVMQGTYGDESRCRAGMGRGAEPGCDSTLKFGPLNCGYTYHRGMRIHANVHLGPTAVRSTHVRGAAAKSVSRHAESHNGHWGVSRHLAAHMVEVHPDT